MSLNNEQTLTILNAIRDMGSEDYKQCIPKATYKNIAEFSNALNQYTTHKLYFYDQLHSVIALTLYKNGDYTNSVFDSFRKGRTLTGTQVRQILTTIVQNIDKFSHEGLTVFKRRKPAKFYVEYYIENRKDTYSVTIDEVSAQGSFTSVEQMGSFIEGQVRALYDTASIGEYTSCKYALSRYGKNGKYTEILDSDDLTAKEIAQYKFANGWFIYGNATTETDDLIIDEQYILINSNDDFEKFTEFYTYNCLEQGNVDDDFLYYYINDKSSNAKELVKQLRAFGKLIKEPTGKFNVANALRSTKVTDMVLFIDTEYESEIEVEVQAYAFNGGKTDITGDVRTINHLGAMLGDETVKALYIHKDLLKIFTTLEEMRTAENAEGLFRNYFFHIYQMIVTSSFETACAFKVVEKETEIEEEQET